MHRPMNEQLSLFIEENTLFNGGVQQLMDMDFKGCIKTLEYYRKLYPWGRSVDRERDMCLFWIERLGETAALHCDPEEGERRYRAWLEFEEIFGYPWPDHGIERPFGVRYFSCVAKGLESCGHGRGPRLPAGTPMGLIYLRAGRPERAVALLQSLIETEEEDARAYGYLGDAFVSRGDTATARICYLKAFTLGPREVDVEHLLDTEVRDRLRDLAQQESVQGDSLGWFAAMGMLEGLFEPAVVRDVEDLRSWRRRYERLLEAQEREQDPALVPRLFAHALVLSEHARTLGLTRDFDLVDVRRRMKEWRPDLFSLYMEGLGERTSRSKVRFL